MFSQKAGSMFLRGHKAGPGIRPLQGPSERAIRLGDVDRDATTQAAERIGAGAGDHPERR